MDESYVVGGFTREIAQWLRTLVAFFKGPEFSSWHPNGGQQAPVILV